MIRVTEETYQPVLFLSEEAQHKHILVSREAGQPSVVSCFDRVESECILDFVVADGTGGHGFALFRTAKGGICLLNTANAERYSFDQVGAQEVSSKLFWDGPSQSLQVCQVMQHLKITWWRLHLNDAFPSKLAEGSLSQSKLFLGFYPGIRGLWAIVQESDRWFWLQDGKTSSETIQRWWSAGEAPQDVKRVVFSEGGDAAVIVRENGKPQMWTWFEEIEPRLSYEFALERTGSVEIVIWRENEYCLVTSQEDDTKLVVIAQQAFSQKAFKVLPLKIVSCISVDLFNEGRSVFLMLLSDSSINVFDAEGHLEARFSSEDPLILPSLTKGFIAGSQALTKRIERGAAEVARRRANLLENQFVVERLEAAIASASEEAFLWPANVRLVDLPTGEKWYESRQQDLELAPQHVGRHVEAWFHGPTSFLAVHIRFNTDFPQESETLSVFLTSMHANIKRGNFNALSRFDYLVWAAVHPVDTRLDRMQFDIIAHVSNRRTGNLVCSMHVMLSAVLHSEWIRLSDGKLETPPRLLFQSHSLSMLAKAKDIAEVVHLDVYAADEVRLTATIATLSAKYESITPNWSALLPLARLLVSSLLNERDGGKEHLSAIRECDEYAALLLSRLLAHRDLAEDLINRGEFTYS